MTSRLATRACEVRAHVRKLPPKKCGIENDIHRALMREVKPRVRVQAPARRWPSYVWRW